MTPEQEGGGGKKRKGGERSSGETAACSKCRPQFILYLSTAKAWLLKGGGEKKKGEKEGGGEEESVGRPSDYLAEGVYMLSLTTNSLSAT